MKAMKFLAAVCVLFCNKDITAFHPQELVEHVQKSIDRAWKHNSKLTQDVLSIDGLSSSKVRHLLNNLCSLAGATYLEVGVYRGSTFIAALFGNTHHLAHAVAIDNWSEFGYQKDIFLDNAHRFLATDSFTFHEGDSFSNNVFNLFSTPVTIYFYDGFHSAQAQKQAFTHFNPVLAHTFIAIIDDWNWREVQEGTKAAFKELNYHIIFEQALPSYTPSDSQQWWNGLYVAVVQKANS